MDCIVLIWEFWLCFGMVIFVVLFMLFVKEVFEEIYNVGWCIFVLWSVNVMWGLFFFNLIIFLVICVVIFYEVDLGLVVVLGIFSIKFCYYFMIWCKFDN